MLDDDERAGEVVADQRQRVDELVALLLVEPGRRLVQHQEGGLRGERPHDPESPLEPVRQTDSVEAGHVVELQPLEQLTGPLSGGRPAHADADAAELDVLEHGQARKEAHRLERARETAPGESVRAQAGDVVAVHQNRPGGRLLESGERVDKCGLARAVRADQAQDLALLQDEVDPVDRVDASEVNLEAARLEQLGVVRVGRLGLRRGTRSLHQVNLTHCITDAGAQLTGSRASERKPRSPRSSARPREGRAFSPRAPLSMFTG